MQSATADQKFGDIHEGMPLPSLTKEVTLEQFAMYAAVCWDFHPMHYDSVTGKELGFRAALADGPMLAAFLGQVVTVWLGPESRVKRLQTRYLAPVFPRDVLHCMGTVLGKTEGDDPTVECEVWAENQDGIRVVTGMVTAAPPPRR